MSEQSARFARDHRHIRIEFQWLENVMPMISNETKPRLLSL